MKYVKHKLSIMDKALVVLSRKYVALSAYTIMDTLEDEGTDIKNIDSFKIMLHGLKTRGLIDTDKANCHCCGQIVTEYRLTDDGKIYVNSLNPPSISIKQFADL